MEEAGVQSEGSCSVPGKLLSKKRMGSSSILSDGIWKMIYLVLLTLIAILLL
jgi:hypothetical protein